MNRSTRLASRPLPCRLMVRSTSAILGVCALQACASLSPAELANPVPLHDARVPFGGSATPLQEKALDANAVVPERYYAAMSNARAANAPQTAIDAYVAEGVATVQLYCMRWFAKIEDAQRNVQVQDTNRNIISQLGTMGIGLAKLHPDVTAVYGALNTAIGGFNSNLSSAYLTAPNAENVKRLTLDAIAGQAAAIRVSGSPLYPTDFSTAYVRLEKLAAQCTYAEVKGLTNKSVDLAKISITKEGNVEVFGSATIAQATVLMPRLLNMQRSIAALKPEQAIAFVSFMPSQGDPNIRKAVASDTQGARFRDSDRAKALLQACLMLTSGSDSQLQEWESRLAQLTK